MKIVLHKNCVPVRGHSRSAICDLGRNEVKLIPNSLQEILEKYEGKSISFIKETYNHEYDDTIDEYMTFMIENEYIFLTETPELFPKMNLDFEYNSDITNSIIDVSKENEIHIPKVLKELSDMGCSALQIRFYELTDQRVLLDILENLKRSKSSIVSLEILITSDWGFSDNELLLLLKNYPRLMHLIICNSETNHTIKSPHNDYAFITFTKQNVISEKNCGVIKKDYFSINIRTFSESISHNSCLSHKISIDRKGNIKNCPSMKQSFGNIKDISIQDALKDSDFKKYWNITKDHITVCRDCEFRYICTDCRAYLENPDDSISKPLKCGYDPYTNKWEDWTKNPLKKNAIDHYGLQELIFDQ